MRKACSLSGKGKANNDDKENKDDTSEKEISEYGNTEDEELLICDDEFEKDMRESEMIKEDMIKNKV